MTIVSLLGTGLMGLPMAQRLLDAEVPLVVYNRTRSKLALLQSAHVSLADSPSEAIRSSDLIILLLTDKSAIRQVVLSDEARSYLAGRTVVQMGTIAPQESQALQRDIQAAGGSYLEAPVLGSIPEAKAGELIVMVGSTLAQFQQWSSVLAHFGSNPLYVGEVGTAAALKLAMNQLIGALTAAFSLSLGLVEQYGVDVDLFMQVVRQSALYAPTFDKKLARMLDRNFDHPNFPTKHLLKDTNLAIDAAESVDLNTIILHGLRQVLNEAMAQNLADSDYSSLFSVINPASP